MYFIVDKNYWILGVGMKKGKISGMDMEEVVNYSVVMCSFFFSNWFLKLFYFIRMMRDCKIKGS